MKGKKKKANRKGAKGKSTARGQTAKVKQTKRGRPEAAKQKPEEKHAGGRPEIEYDVEKHPKQMLYLRRQKDMTNEKIAELMGVSHDTLERWREKHPEFCVAYNTALLDVKAGLLHSAYECANGYSHERKTVVPGVGEAVIEEYFPKNPTMIKFLAVNVLGMADTQHITTPPGQPLQVQGLPELSGAPDEKLDKAIALGEKLLGKLARKGA